MDGMGLCWWLVSVRYLSDGTLKDGLMSLMIDRGGGENGDKMGGRKYSRAQWEEAKDPESFVTRKGA